MAFGIFVKLAFLSEESCRSLPMALKQFCDGLPELAGLVRAALIFSEPSSLPVIPSDLEPSLVPNGSGAVSGWPHDKHVVWAIRQSHLFEHGA